MKHISDMMVPMKNPNADVSINHNSSVGSSDVNADNQTHRQRGQPINLKMNFSDCIFKNLG